MDSATARMKHLALTMLLLTIPAQACTLAVGYFHQVTHLRGTVVGVNSNRDLRGLFRWSRRMVARDNAELKLYEYRSPDRDMGERRVVRRTTTESQGSFDFGDLPDGHYTLSTGEQIFDVQITKLPKATKSVTIDISPFGPNCQGVTSSK